MSLHDNQRTGYSSSIGVRLQNISFAYGQREIFSQFNLSISPGQTTAILGPSGIGKSCLLRILAGLTRPETGTLLTSDEKSLDGRVAYMDQRDLLLPWLSVLNNVDLGTRLRNQRANPGRAKQLIAKVGLSGQENSRPQTLSGGMRQRTALARTLMEDRPLVLMDEPFSALDALSRHRLQELAAQLLKHKTVVLVTHDPLEALRLADEIVVFSGEPVSPGGAFCPEGQPPRDPHNEAMLKHYGTLMHQLRAAERSDSAPYDGEVT